MRNSVRMRKVQLTGGSTYVVSLPKNWAKKVGLKPGDYVSLIPQPDSSLLIIPKEFKKGEELSEIFLDVSTTKSPDDIVREIIACYLVGYDVIRLNLGRKGTKYRTYIKNVMRQKLIGVETIEETAEHMVIRCLLGWSELPVKDALNRMYIMALSMHEDAVIALKEGDVTLANDIVQRDDEVDRLYFFIVRQLKMAVEDRSIIERIGVSDARDCLGYRLIAKSIERIADHASRIAQVIPTIKREEIDEEVITLLTKMSQISVDICRNAMNSLYQLDVNQANQTIAKSEEILGLEERIIERILQADLSSMTIIGLRLILESIRRTAEYGTDIAEIAINLARKRAITF